MKGFYFSFAFIFSLSVFYGQDTLVRFGTYRQKNIYVSGNLKNQGADFCTQKVLVNGKEVSFENANAYEIDLAPLKLKDGENIKLEIIHAKNCKPNILVEFNCFPKNRYEFFLVKIESDSMLMWISSEKDGKFTYIIEQFRWNKWVKIGEEDSKSGFDTVSYQFNLKQYIHSGENKFRIKGTTFSGTPPFSKTLTLKKPEEKNPAPKNNPETKSIDLEKTTLYELCDTYGNIVKRGIGKSIPTKQISKGKYFLNYDNKTETIYLP